MEIDITDFVTNADPSDFSGGDNVAQETWRAAVNKGKRAPLLTTPEQLDALRQHVKGFGAWDDDEIAAWPDAECNALFIQLISGDMREAGMYDVSPNEFDWAEYEGNQETGCMGSNIYRGNDGCIYYYLGE